MFIFTARVNRKKIIYSILAAAAVVCVILFLTSRSDTAPTAAIASRNAGDNAERVAFLESFGWLVLQEPMATEEVTIPETMDETYQAYLDLQKEQGFDLSKYCGKHVKRFSYEILNYPTGETGVTANLLVYKNKIIGGDVSSAALDGFMHGLNYPAQD
jgi:hypothetical protein